MSRTEGNRKYLNRRIAWKRLEASLTAWGSGMGVEGGEGN